MRIYLDNCSYNRPYDDQSNMQVQLEAQSKLFIQNSIKDGKYDLVSSYTLQYEISKNPFDMRRNAIEEFIEQNAKYYVDYNREPELTAIASEIMETGVKEKDAYHVASAIFGGCEYFISTDKRLLKYTSEKIKLVTPVEFVSETEGDE
ncbi:type II toxin-antitoxin system VapC family toxin [Butyrivibrio sp. VCD2006]|uniref:type II toxin-antitoxin system VapC family toxin n=1 Tax=Butyrivibrio sp. VCD2006 TaxID=1280664 RepID=UPI00047BC1D4|nr:type II toxin-antitoxin system VapC family toxin [Butyrivibrio sp. VCD2006]